MSGFFLYVRFYLQSRQSLGVQAIPLPFIHLYDVKHYIIYQYQHPHPHKGATDALKYNTHTHMRVRNPTPSHTRTFLHIHPQTLAQFHVMVRARLRPREGAVDTLTHKSPWGNAIR